MDNENLLRLLEIADDSGLYKAKPVKVIDPDGEIYNIIDVEWDDAADGYFLHVQWEGSS